MTAVAEWQQVETAAETERQRESISSGVAAVETAAETERKFSMLRNRKLGSRKIQEFIK